MKNLFLHTARIEGIASAFTRAREHAAEWLHDRALLRQNRITTNTLLNVIAFPLRAGFGGVGVQLRERLAVERASRSVALMRGSVLGGLLETSGPPASARRLDFGPTIALHDERFAAAFERALSMTEAHAVHLEGAAGVPTRTLLEVLGGTRRLIVSLHDFALWSGSSHLVDPETGDEERRSVGKALLDRAQAVVFPSPYLLDQHVKLFGLDRERAHVVRPGISRPARRRASPGFRRVAFAGALHSHKGSGLLPELLELSRDQRLEWHIFGGGDARPLRSAESAQVIVHGYYRAGTLPSLLVEHEIDVLVMPSIVPESFSLVVSEAWAAGVPVIAFDSGAIGDRIREHGGGWLVDPLTGAAGMADAIRAWAAERRATEVPRAVPFADESAEAMLALYARLHLLNS